jgi:nicotinic acid phosphoribosyltransferase
MLRAALHSGVAGRRSVFEVFARHLPHGRRYGVVAGTGRLLDALAAFRFGELELDFVSAAGLADELRHEPARSQRRGRLISAGQEADRSVSELWLLCARAPRR